MSNFAKVLIANRGEIACRIMRTLHDMDIASAAIYHHSEDSAGHVQMACEAFEVTGTPAVSAYLDGKQIIDIAKTSGADAIHPGYGFLSENAGFADAVNKAGLCFIGPDAATMRKMGDKIKAREFAAELGVPVAPSIMPRDSIDDFLKDAEHIGFPLLIKAAAGGGGRGMRIVETATSLPEQAALAIAEAERYFSDGRIYAERYVARPRHIEVQIMGDGEGGAVHLHERECSVQRRFQKIIEEAPAPNLPPELRDKICAAAVHLAQGCHYRNAGTVEFILAPDGEFYFLEMNTRLQVEHPVTEMITGLDLVQLQIDIAQGTAAPLRQSDIQTSGHAIECRICAEDPSQDFTPETGRVLALAPATGTHLRFESGLTEGQTITSQFDSMLAKLVACGTDRNAAVDATVHALRNTVLLGVGTNLDFLARVVDHPAFRAGRLHTGFLQEFSEDLHPTELPAAERDALLLMAAMATKPFETLVHDVPQPYATMAGWRN